MIQPRNRALAQFLLHCLLSGLGTTSLWSGELPSVRMERLPTGAVQPKLVRSSNGTLHLVYLSGDSKAADVFYQSRLAVPDSKWSNPVRVNSEAGSAIAIGTIRGPDITLGRGDSVHVVWNGSSKANAGSTNGSPFLYSNSKSNPPRFSTERILNPTTRHLDGGGAITADTDGNIYAFWHSSGSTVPDGEEFRTVFMVQSKDQGASFSVPRSISPASLGACGCCGLSALAESNGSLHVLFRSAGQRQNRDMILLTSRDRGSSFHQTSTDPWKATQCPMSLPSMAIGSGSSLLLAWETGASVKWARLDGNPATGLDAKLPAGTGKRKHPVAIQNSQAFTLHLWSEGTGWQKGGAVEWQLFDANGNPIANVHHIDGLPVWGRPTAALLPGDRDFLVLF